MIKYFEPLLRPPEQKKQKATFQNINFIKKNSVFPNRQGKFLNLDSVKVKIPNSSENCENFSVVPKREVKIWLKLLIDIQFKSKKLTLS